MLRKEIKILIDHFYLHHSNNLGWYFQSCCDYIYLIPKQSELMLTKEEEQYYLEKLVNLFHVIDECRWGDHHVYLSIHEHRLSKSHIKVIPNYNLEDEESYDQVNLHNIISSSLGDINCIQPTLLTLEMFKEFKWTKGTDYDVNTRLIREELSSNDPLNENSPEEIIVYGNIWWGDLKCPRVIPDWIKNID